MPLSHWSVVKSSVACGAQVRRAMHAQALERPAPDAPLDAAFRSMLPRLARYRAAWGDANVPCALAAAVPARTYEHERMRRPG